MNKRQFLLAAGVLGTYAALRNVSWASEQEQAVSMSSAVPEFKWGKMMSPDERITLSDAEWKQRLDPERYRVLRKEGTERAGTSPLNDEKRSG
ncbi:MAG: peptide-methionine (R)-S-oxide reductase, partial [Pseudomonadota bacterium]